MGIELPTNREPSHPGKILLKDFLEPNNISIEEFAEKVEKISDVNKSIWNIYLSSLVAELCSIHPLVAIRISKVLNMEPEFWINLQHRWDLWAVKYYQSKLKENDKCFSQMH